VDFVEEFSCAACGMHPGDACLRMVDQNSDEFSGGVARPSYDADPYHCAKFSTRIVKFFEFGKLLKNC